MFVYLIKPCRHNVFINIDANEKGAIKLTFLLQMEDFNMSRFNTNWLRRTFIATLGTMLLGVFVMQTTEAKAEWPEKPIKMFRQNLNICLKRGGKDVNKHMIL